MWEMWRFDRPNKVTYIAMVALSVGRAARAMQYYMVTGQPIMPTYLYVKPGLPLPKNVERW